MLVIAGVHSCLIGYTSSRLSATMDEPAHLAAGVSYLELGSFGLYRVNPPLVKLIAALPAWMLNCRTDYRRYNTTGTARTEFLVGTDFANVNANRFEELLFYSRLALLPFSLLGLWACYQLSRDLWSDDAAVASGILWAFSPMVIGHGSLITNDVPAAALCATCVLMMRRWLVDGNGPHALIFACVCGLALLTKTTTVFLIPLFLLSVTVRIVNGVSADRSRILTQAIGIVVIAWYVLNSGYLWHGTGSSLSSIPLKSFPLTSNADDRSIEVRNSLPSWIGALPCPVPDDFLRGIDLQSHDFRTIRGGHLTHTYLSGGRWYFPLYAALVKMPESVLLLFLVTLWPVGIRARLSKSWDIVLAGLLLIVAVLISNRMDDHFRYAIPAFPFLFAWLGQYQLASNQLKSRSLRVVALLPYGVLTLTAISTVPSVISSFNFSSGGPATGHLHILGSDVDWGENLILLREWCQKNYVRRPIILAHHGPVDPALYGINWRPLTMERNSSLTDDVDEYLVVSVNVLFGSHESPKSRMFEGNQREFSASPFRKTLQSSHPLARVGGLVVFNASGLNSNTSDSLH
jgi:hypothetical protein